MHFRNAGIVVAVSAVLWLIFEFQWWLAVLCFLALFRELYFDQEFPEIQIPPAATEIDPDVKDRKPTKRICAVIGASGFVGKVLVQGLLEQGKYDIVRAIDITKPNFQDPKVENIQGNLLDLPVLLTNLTDVETVFHLASLVSLRDTPPSRHKLWTVNVKGCRNVLNAAIRRGVKKFVYTSSSAIVFDGVQKYYSEANCEANPPRPLSQYGVTKGKAEKFVLSSNGIKGLKTISLRPFFIFGQGDNFYVKKYLEGVPSLPGKNTFSTCYVGNLVHWELLADESLDKKSEITAGQAYFVADDEKPPVKGELDRFTISAINRPFKQMSFSFFRALTEIMPYFDWYTCGVYNGDLWELNPATYSFSLGPAFFDISKGIKDLGYQRKYSNEDIRRIIREYYKIEE